jgi:predicted nuclease of restriction endonuclease-like (RecB) superfamily
MKTGEISKNYIDILNDLKEKIIKARMSTAIAVNNELLKIYWEIGHSIYEQEQASNWGSKTIEKLAHDLNSEFPEMKGLSARNLRYMKDFAIAYPEFLILQQSIAKLKDANNQPLIILQQSVAKLPWGHNCTILDRLKLPEERLFYVQKTLHFGWTRNMLVYQIENMLYQTQGALVNNFKTTVPDYQSELAAQLFRDPYNLDFIMLGESAKERDLEKAIMDKVTQFLLALGEGFAFMGRQMQFEAGGKVFYIDLLFYHTKLRRHIIIELKIGDFEAEFVSKMNLYLGLADDKLKGENDNPSIGLILCKTNNKVIAEYALRDTTKPIGIAEYKIGVLLPDNIKGELPSIEEIEQKMDEELKAQETPVDKRLRTIKEKLKNIKGDEIQTRVTHTILARLYFTELKSLYQKIIAHLKIFQTEFYNRKYSWSIQNKHFKTFAELNEFLKNEGDLTRLGDLYFSFGFEGFKKAGTENLDAGIQLNFVASTYWYEFTLVNHNNQQPFLKKLYHQEITVDDTQTILDKLMTAIMDRMEWIIESIKKA